MLNLKFFKKIDGNFKNFLLAAKLFSVFFSECVLNSNRNFSRFSKINVLIFTGLHVKILKKFCILIIFSHVLKSNLIKVQFLQINLKNLNRAMLCLGWIGQ